MASPARAPAGLQQQQQQQQPQVAASEGSQQQARVYVKAPEVVTLVNLTRSAYHLVLVNDEIQQRIHSEMRPFYKALCELVVLANLEICTVRNIVLEAGNGVLPQATGPPPPGQQPSSRVVAQLDGWGEVELNSMEELPSAWCELIRTTATVHQGHPDTLVVQRCIQARLDDASKELHGRVKQALTTASEAGNEDMRTEVEASLTLIAKAYAAYRADLVDCADLLSSETTKQQRASAVAPVLLADLAVKLLVLVAERLPTECTLARTRVHQNRTRKTTGKPKGPKNFPSNTLKKILRAACQSGQSELVKQLLDLRNAKTTAEQAILEKSNADGVWECFCAAWTGYASRTGRHAGGGGQGPTRTADPDHLRQDARQELSQEDDWLDYKHSSDRARMIARELVEYILWWEGKHPERQQPQQAEPLGGGSAGSTGAGGQVYDLPDDSWECLQRLLRNRPGVACKPLAAALLEVAKDNAKLLTEDSINTAIAAPTADLAVKACQAAIAADSVEAVEEAVEFLSDHKQFWPALSLELLTQLAGRFPHQTVSLLAKVDLTQLQESTYDNVLPFRLSPGFRAIAISPHDQHTFGQKSAPDGHSLGLSTKDADHFSNETVRDQTIEGSLLIRPATWLCFLLFFDGREVRSPTAQLMARTVACIGFTFLSQGPGSLMLLILAVLLLGVVALLSRLCTWAVTVPLGLIFGLVKALRRPRRRPTSHVSRRKKQTTQVVPANSDVGNRSAAGISNETRRQGSRPSGPTDQGLRSFWRSFNTPHWWFVDWLLGWGHRSTIISCRKVPMAVDFRTQHDSKLLEELLRAPDMPSSVFSSKVLRALITFKWHYFIKYVIMMQLVFHLIYMTVFLLYGFTVKDIEPINGRPGSGGPAGARASRLLKDTTGPSSSSTNSTRAGGMGAGGSGGDDGGEGSGIMFGAQGSLTCELPAPTTLQLSYLIALGTFTIDLAFQEIRQIAHFGWRYFYHAWDVLDILSVVLMTIIIVSHFMCSLGPLQVSPDELRLMIAAQTLLLFMRLLYYAMAFERLGEFVSMVLSTFQALALFAAFLVVVVFGFAMSIILAQGSQSSIGSEFKAVIMKLYTMIYGDFDLDFLEDPWSMGFEDGGSATAAISAFVALFMLVVTIVLLNLLIAIVNESYNTIRAKARFELLRNKAFLIVSTESLLRRFNFLWPLLKIARCCRGGDDRKRGEGLVIDWIYTTLSEPFSSADSSKSGNTGGTDSGAAKYSRYVYLITPERSRAQRRDDAGAFAEEEEATWSAQIDAIRRLMSELDSNTKRYVAAVREDVKRLESAQQEQKDTRTPDADGQHGTKGDTGSGGGSGGGGEGAVAASALSTAAPAASTGGADLSDAGVLRRFADQIADVLEPRLRRDVAAAPSLNNSLGTGSSPGGGPPLRRRLGQLPPLS